MRAHYKIKTMLKKILLWLFLGATLIGSGSFVFGYNFIFITEVALVSKLSPNIYTDSVKLNSTILGFSSPSDISFYQLHSNCEIESKYIENSKSVYYFNISFPQDCKNPNIVLKSEEEVLLNSTTKLNFVSKADVFEMLVDYTTDDLKKFQTSLEKEIASLSLYKNYDGTSLGKNYDFAKKQRKYEESLYKKTLVQDILIAREKNYISPVVGKVIPETLSKIPNAGRPYRASYTDGIHHGWDIAWALWEKVVALDDGIIVRTVENFDFADLDKINYSSSLTSEDKLKNLDILRGKQVWLKTSKGEVVFYAHLNEVFDYIDEWSFVTAGTPLGTIGNSWVPEKDYDDYHLHFEIQSNPYNKNLAGTYTFEDYLKWDWKLKGLASQDILIQQKKIFSY
jgi:murein DD-endopeptidase MepM/ murein hydrolase activator NlpD